MGAGKARNAYVRNRTEIAVAAKIFTTGCFAVVDP